MKHDTSRTPGDLSTHAGQALRERAEKRLETQKAEDKKHRTAFGRPRLLYELEVHQIELEMQNAELRSARAEIEASQARYFNLYDLAPVGYVTVSGKGLIQETNLTAATLLGVDRVALVRQPLSLFILKEDQGLYDLLCKKVQEPRSEQAGLVGTTQACELRMVKPDGEVFWVKLDATAADNSDDDAPACRVVMSDISERKRTEAGNRLLEVQLQQARKMELVGRLAGGVAHEFNNLLMGIMGYTDLCLDAIEPGHPIRAYLDEITSTAQRSAGIARQLLAFARKQTIAPRALDLNDAVGGMLKLLRQLIGENIKLTWRPGTDLRPVKLDPSQVDQILTNLCVNARDAIAGVGEITLKTGSITFDAEFCAKRPEAIPGEYVFLAVSDNGGGMDAETMAQIFEPFFTTKGVGKGTGLGLATVYGIVKQNNGYIYATSEPGKGTTFTIYLPEMTTESISAAVTRKTEMPRGRGETVLLAEDERLLRVTCSLSLKGLGYEVLSAETPAAALKLVDQHPGDIHLLLTDVIMSEMDGGQLAQRIIAAKPDIKVVFMSGYSADLLARRGVLDEGVQFLAKPFTRDDLACKLREVLDT